jgi:hypothetical protein
MNPQKVAIPVETGAHRFYIYWNLHDYVLKSMTKNGAFAPISTPSQLLVRIKMQSRTYCSKVPNLWRGI